MALPNMAPKDSYPPLAEAKLASSGISPTEGHVLSVEYLADASIVSPQFFAVPALYITYRDIDGSDSGFYRIRYLATLPGFAGQMAKPQRYAQPKGTMNWVYLPHTADSDWDAIAKDASRPLIITEGELKACCAQLLGFNTIALGGVAVVQSPKKGVSLLPPLDKFNWKGRSVTVIFDSDAASNPQVASASVRLARLLLNRGALPKVASLPSTAGGQKQGLDDYLVSGGDLVHIIETARTIELGEHLTRLNESYMYVKKQDVVVELSSGSLVKRDTFVNGTLADERFIEFVPTATAVKKVEVVIAKEWLQWPSRRIATDIVYEPGKPRVLENNEYNAWKSWGCVPSAGCVARWHTLMEHVFQDAPKDREWFEQWLAYPLQYPGVKMYTAALFWGPETGTGKSIIGEAIGEIYGDNYSEIQHSDLFSSFNSWAKGKQFIMGNEISGSDKRNEADGIKNLITRQMAQINEKFLPAYAIRDCMNYYLTSNHPDGLFLEDQDRRLFIHRMPKKRLSQEFYNNFMEWIRYEDGKANLFYYLLNLPLTGFSPKSAAPLTAAKAEMIYHGQSNLGGFIQELVNNTDSVLSDLAHKNSISESPDIVKNEHLLALHDPDGRSRVGSRGIGRAMASAGFPLIQIQRTKAFGTVRLYIVRNQDKWKEATIDELREYIDRVYKSFIKPDFIKPQGAKY